MLTAAQVLDGLKSVLIFLVAFLIFVALIEGLLYIVVGGARKTSPIRLLAPVAVAVAGLLLMLDRGPDFPWFQFSLNSSWLHFLLMTIMAEVVVLGLLLNIKVLAPIGLLLLTIAAMARLGLPPAPPGAASPFLIDEWPFILTAGITLTGLMIGALTQPKVSLAYMLIAPAVIAIALLVIYPFVYTVFLAFSDASGKDFNFLRYGKATYSLQQGWDNFSRVFSGTLLPDVNSTFWNLLGITVAWTAINVVFHVSGGMGLALLLNRDMSRWGKAIYRTILILPWAIPGIIAILAFSGEFNGTYGFINIMLRDIHVNFLGIHINIDNPPQWQSDSTYAFVMVCIINIWLGIPFMMVSILGGLQSISKEFYEAAEIDGANGWQQFRNITIPLIQPVLTPIIILGTIWTFNNFNVIYLADRQGKTNILVTALYRIFGDLRNYHLAAAFSLVIFILLMIFAIGWIRLNGGLKGVYES
jgi:arabinogalactan oligomer / maltooligosaccharide transport system permease protein